MLPMRGGSVGIVANVIITAETATAIAFAIARRFRAGFVDSSLLSKSSLSYSLKFEVSIVRQLCGNVVKILRYAVLLCYAVL